MITLFGARPGRSQTDKPWIVPAAPQKGDLILQVKPFANPHQGTVMRLENITVFEECFPSHVMLLKLFIRRAG